MLLTEIIATRHTRENDPRGQYEFIPDIEASSKESSLGAMQVTIRVTKEEQNFYDRYKLPHPPKSFPVVYAYSLPQSGTEENRTILDAIKKRKPLKADDPTSFMTDENLKLFMTAAVQKLRYGAGGPNAGQAFKKRKTTLNTINQFARWISSGDESIIIVPLDSSSEVVTMMAQILAKEITAPIIDGTFIKTLPHLSKFKENPKTGEFDPRQNQAKDYHERSRRYMMSIANFERQIDALTSSNRVTDVTNRRIAQLEEKKQKIQDKLRNLKFQVKKVNRAATDAGRAYYKIQQVLPEKAKQLSGMRIILVDDNIDSGLSMADAIKGLYRVGVVPTDIMGFCPHRLTSS